MRMTVTGLAFAAMALATPVFAQAANPPPIPRPPPDAASCQAERAALEQDMAQARARGQMLRRRELADTLAALEARCESATPVLSKAAQIQRLEQEIRALQQEIDHASEQLRKLRRETP